MRCTSLIQCKRKECGQCTHQKLSLLGWGLVLSEGPVFELASPTSQLVGLIKKSPFAFTLQPEVAVVITVYITTRSNCILGIFVATSKLRKSMMNLLSLI